MELEIFLRVCESDVRARRVGCERGNRMSNWETLSAGGRDLEKGELRMGRSISGTFFPLSNPKAACGRLFTVTQWEELGTALWAGLS